MTAASMARSFWQHAPDRPPLDRAVQLINLCMTKSSQTALDLALEIAADFAPLFPHSVLNHAVQADKLPLIRALLPHYDPQKDQGAILRTAVLANSPASVQEILTQTPLRPDLSVLNTAQSVSMAERLVAHTSSQDLTAWCASRFQGSIPPKAEDIQIFPVYWDVLSDKERTEVWASHNSQTHQWLMKKCPSIAAWCSAKEIAAALNNGAPPNDKPPPFKM